MSRVIARLAFVALVALSLLPALAARPAFGQAPAPTTPAATTPAVLRPDPAIACTSCPEWNAPRTPFKVFGNTYFEIGRAHV